MVESECMYITICTHQLTEHVNINRIVNVNLMSFHVVLSISFHFGLVPIIIGVRFSLSDRLLSSSHYL